MSTCGAPAPSPASDGKRVFALFSSNDLICLDLDGNLQWFRGLTFDHPNVSNSLGMASSPVVVGDTLVAQVENDSQSLATGIDVATGKTVVRVDPRYFRPTEVETLLGDPSKALRKLGWRATISFEQLVHDMVAGDLEHARRDALIAREGFKTYRHHE